MTTVRVRAIREGDASFLLGVEQRADALLDAQRLHTPVPAPSREDFGRFLSRHTIVVAEAGGVPVGYAAGRDLGALYWLAALAVDPAHGRKGVGRRLVAAICAEAKMLFHRAIGLTTYRDVPFNAPFYARCGFLTVPRQSLDATFEDRLVAETPAGARSQDRVAMVKWL